MIDKDYGLHLSKECSRAAVHCQVLLSEKFGRTVTQEETVLRALNLYFSVLRGESDVSGSSEAKQ